MDVRQKADVQIGEVNQMSDEIMLMIGDDGKAALYDDTFDITIHCESEEEQNEVKKALESIPKWIPVSERLPEEHDSIFSKLYGTEKWRNAMFRRSSRTVIITVEYKDGTRQTAPCHTIDGEWNQSIKGMGKVLAWMPLPEPYKEEEE